jgi:hypothetical protein
MYVVVKAKLMKRIIKICQTLDPITKTEDLKTIHKPGRSSSPSVPVPSPGSHPGRMIWNRAIPRAFPLAYRKIQMIRLEPFI